MQRSYEDAARRTGPIGDTEPGSLRRPRRRQTRTISRCRVTINNRRDGRAPAPVGEDTLGLAPDESRGNGPSRGAVVRAIPPETVKEALARQAVGLAHDQDRELGLAAR